MIVNAVRLLILALIFVPLRAENCAPAAQLAPTDSQSGQLDETSCQLSDGTAYAQYEVTFPVRGSLTLTAKGTNGLLPSIIIRNQNGNLVNPPTATPASVSRYIESGVYRVRVNARATGQTGGFTIASVFAPEPNILCTQSRNMGAGHPVAGRFLASSCKLPDGSSFDSWQLTVYGAGTLNLSLTSSDFSTYLILRGPDGVAIAADGGSGGGNNSSISLAVPGNETYTVIAAAANASQKPGAYQLSATFTPLEGETCVTQGVLSSGAQAAGSVSGGSCNFDLPGREDSSLFNFYDLHVDATGVAQLQVTSSSFSPLLLLLDANGNEVTEDSQSAGIGMPMIQQQLNPGDYRLMIFNEDSFDGAYTLQYNFAAGPSARCPVQVLSTSSSVAGALSSASSCRVATSMADVYQAVLPEPGTLNINMSSGDFTTFLVLRDSKDNVIDYGQQTPDGSSSNVSLSLPAGTYYVAASSADLPGNYQIAYQFNAQPLPACSPPRKLPINSDAVSSLGSGSCIGSDGQFVDVYEFAVSGDGTVEALMLSGALPGELELTDAKDTELRLDAGSYSQGNSIIVQYLKAGTYRLRARSNEYNVTGQYQVGVRFTESASKPSYCGPRLMQIGLPRSGSLNYTSCQYYDGTFSDFYKFSVLNSIKPVNITDVSSAFDSYLVLMDEKGSILATNENGSGVTSAQITGMLAAGTYYAVVKPSGSPTAVGAYSLTISQ